MIWGENGWGNLSSFARLYLRTSRASQTWRKLRSTGQQLSTWNTHWTVGDFLGTPRVLPHLPDSEPGEVSSPKRFYSNVRPHLFSKLILHRWYIWLGLHLANPIDR